MCFWISELGSPDNELTRFQSGKYLAETLQGYRVAAVGGNRPSFVNHFAETVARNRGAWFMALAEEQDALDWLLTHK